MGDGGDLDIVLWCVVGTGDPDKDVLELRFAPSSDREQLRGEPGHLFTTPDPGEDLVLFLPAPAPGTVFDEELIVYRDETSALKLPIKVKHEI